MPDPEIETGRPEQADERTDTVPATAGTAVAVDEPPATTAVEDDARKPKKKRKDKAAGAAPDGLLGSAKAVETMFRNAIRAELDLIALAATKANIMISLNGFIISALMISGAFLFNSSPSFLIPAGVFMLTSAGSIAFALLAASPERVSFTDAMRDWWKAYRQKRAGVRDIRSYVLRGGEQNDQKEGLNLLLYEDRVLVDQDDYWDRMQALLRDRDEIYHKMSDQLYWLGEKANRKFKLLNISYSVFRWGLVASIAVFLIGKAAVWTLPAVTEGTRAAPAMGIEEFSDIYEPSAVQQLPDGRILVVEDEATRAMNVLTIGDDGTLAEDDAADLKITRGFGRTLNDLEGLSVDDQGFVYAITSHSTNNDGQRDPSREQLLRFKITGSQVGDISSFTQLRTSLAGDAALSRAISQQAGEVDFNELNIEGLAFHKQTQHLLIGLREPTAGSMSIVVPMLNPGEVFGGEAQPTYGPPMLLDLQGGGIRALSYDPVLQAFIIVNEIEGPSGDKMSQMWTWSGNANQPPNRLELPNLINLNNVESIDSVTVAGEPRLLLMSDDGDPKENIPAKYMMLEYDDLPKGQATGGAGTSPSTDPSAPAGPASP